MSPNSWGAKDPRGGREVLLILRGVINLMCLNIDESVFNSLVWQKQLNFNGYIKRLFIYLNK